MHHFSDAASHDPAADFEPVIFPEEDAALAIREAAGL